MLSNFSINLIFSINFYYYKHFIAVFLMQIFYFLIREFLVFAFLFFIFFTLVTIHFHRYYTVDLIIQIIYGAPYLL